MHPFRAFAVAVPLLVFASCDGSTGPKPPVAAAFALGPGANGDGLTAVRGTAVSVRPAVRITDKDGDGIAGEVVTFTVLSGGGSVGSATATTDGAGVARVSSWTLGPGLGVNTLQAAYADFAPVVFTVTAIEDPCTPAGATPLALGGIEAGALSNADCVAPDLRRFDLYKFELAAPEGVLFELFATHDAYLVLLAGDNATVIAEVDDIQTGVITDSRIGVALEAGTYFLRASSFLVGEIGTYSISARVAAVGVPTRVEMVAGNGQVVAPGQDAPIAASVRVLDELDLGVSGVTVTFATVPGVGSATGVDAVTDADGVATVGSWNFAAGANVLSATVAGGGVPGSPVIFSGTGNADPAGFDIVLRFLNVPTQGQLDAFNAAAARWESIITGDLPAFVLSSPFPYCNETPPLDESVDDLLIFVRLQAIDGPGGALASAGPCAVRPGSFHPVVGAMRFDTDDLNLANLPNVILHEMAHVLGVGTIWGLKGLLINPSLPSSPGADTHFPGASAIAAFNAAGGSGYVGGKVPVENTQGAQGTRDAHWREGVLGNELMTGFLSAGSNPLSAITVASFQDLGYTVSFDAADAYSLTAAMRAGPPGEGEPIHLLDDVLRVPLRILDPSTQAGANRKGRR